MTDFGISVLLTMDQWDPPKYCNPFYKDQDMIPSPQMEIHSQHVQYLVNVCLPLRFLFDTFS